MEKKMTKVEAFTEILATILDSEVSAIPSVEAIEALKAEIERLKAESLRNIKRKEEKRSKDSTLYADVRASLSMDIGYTATEITNAVKALDTETYAKLSNQKVSSVLRTLIEGGEVTKYVEKGSSKFILATVGEGDC